MPRRWFVRERAPILGFTVLGTLMLHAAAASGCVCSAEPGFLLWPPSGASDVAPDVRIALDAAPSEAPDGGGANKLWLSAIDGQDEIPLLLLEHADNDVTCSHGISLLQPLETLRPVTDYRVHFAGHVLGQFRTGDASKSATKPKHVPQLQWTVVGDIHEPELIATAFVQNQQSDTWLFTFNGIDAHIAALLPPSSAPVRLDFGGVRCPEVSIYNLAGELVATQRLCDADRCLTSSVLGHASCGGNPSAFVEFATLQAQTDLCPATRDARNLHAVTEPEGSGCALVNGSPQPQGCGLWPLWLAGAQLVVRRRERARQQC